MGVPSLASCVRSRFVKWLLLTMAILTLLPGSLARSAPDDESLAQPAPPRGPLDSAPLLPATSVQLQSTSCDMQGVTFVVVGDPQFGVGEPPAGEEASRWAVAAINDIAGGSWPSVWGDCRHMDGSLAFCGGAGETIADPLGVVVVGDLTYHRSFTGHSFPGDSYCATAYPSRECGTWGEPCSFTTYRNLFEDALTYPAYVGLGNHDIASECYSAMLLCGSWEATYSACRNDMWNYVRQRHFAEDAAVPVTRFDLLSTAYSWDWEGVHLLQLQRHGGDVRFGIPSNLDWLGGDLVLAGADTPVVLFQHYGWDSFSTDRCFTEDCSAQDANDGHCVNRNTLELCYTPTITDTDCIDAYSVDCRDVGSADPCSVPSDGADANCISPRRRQQEEYIWWFEQREALDSVISGSNIVAAFHGHLHSRGRYTDADLQGGDVPILRPGRPPVFALVHVTDAYIDVVWYEALDDAGNVTFIDGFTEHFQHPPTVTAYGPQTAVWNQSTDLRLGTFSDWDACDDPWTVQVNWGDGSAATTFTTTVRGTLGLQPHTYTAAGTAFTVTVTVTDAQGLSDNDTFPVYIQAGGPPIAEDDVYATAEEHVLVVPAPGLLGNDSGISPLHAAAPAPCEGFDLDDDGSFTYLPRPDFVGDCVFDYIMWDDYNGSSTAWVTVTVSPVNDRPQLRMQLSEQLKDQTTGEDTDLVLSKATDNRVWVFDPDAGTGLLDATLTAFSGTLTLSGTSGLTFSTGDGTADAVLAFSGQVDAINAALDGMRFTPMLDFNGSTGVQITVDDNGYSGAGGPLVVTGTIGITVDPVNDAPVLDSGGDMVLNTIDEDDTSNAGTVVSAIVTSAGGDRITDVDAGAVEGIAVIGADSTHGTWQYSTDGGGNWYDLGSPSPGAARLLASSAVIRFVPDADYNGTVDPGITFRAWDQSSGTSGGIADTTGNGGTTPFSTATETASITVSPVNDAPVLTPFGPAMTSIGEDDVANPGMTVADIVGTSIGDVDSGALEGIVIYALNSGNGLWLYGTGSSWYAVGAVSTSSALLLRSGDSVRFVPNGENGTVASFSYYAWDQTSGSAWTKVNAVTRGGTTAFSSASDTASIVVIPVNDAPEIMLPYAGQTTDEDTDLILSNATGNRVLVFDPDAGTGLLGVTMMAVSGTLTLSGTSGLTFSTGDGTADAVLAFSGQMDAINAALDGMRFTPMLDFNGSTSVQIAVDDNGYSGVGGPLMGTGTVDVIVSPVNDAPVLDSGGDMVLNTIDEDDTSNAGTVVSAIVASAGGDRITDVDAGALEGIAVIGADSIHGTWQYSTDGGSNWYDLGSPSPGTARLLASSAVIRFVPDADYNGTVDPGITFRAWDQSSGTNGGTVAIASSGGITPFSTATETASIVVRVAADLAVSKFAEPTTVVPGQDAITYTIVVHNPGPSTIVGATLTDALPAALVNPTWTCSASGAACPSPAGSGNLDETLVLPEGSVLTYTITGMVDSSATSLANTAHVDNPAYEIDTGDNSATIVPSLERQADVSIAKSQTWAGSSITYTVVVRNFGPSDAPGATVSDPAPVELGGVLWTCATAGGATCGGGGSGDIDEVIDLPAGSAVTYTLTGVILQVPVVNEATVTPPVAVNDLTSSNNRATVQHLRVYLPLLARSYAWAPNLVVEALVATPDAVTVIIRNQGEAPVVDGFWVDAYVDPSPAPTRVNQTWDMLGSQGLVWGVTTPLQPGEVMTLTVGSPEYWGNLSHVSWPLPAGAQVYAQVDSAGASYGGVLENHEIAGGAYDNVGGPVVIQQRGVAGLSWMKWKLATR